MTQMLLTIDNPKDASLIRKLLSKFGVSGHNGLVAVRQRTKRIVCHINNDKSILR